ncbi:S1C family serine protease [Piscinibacter sp. HJYY11]|uniref:S1C family serine protease n=1 Tax=Piscinibacter sp. HJYY11 TaxID=2801333 RepID=UPI00191F2A92|nr:S1C family serine protease [Piscinibacter sp. HJYY11]MBL0726228.1 serine protease [Piscinibacter sp. HJYY11]
MIERLAPSVVGVGDGRGISGSGFTLQDPTLVATAAHVVMDLKAPLIVRTSSSTVEARMALVDEKADLALVRLPQPGSLARRSGLRIARDAPVPGQWVLVLGCPFGTSPTTTIGIVSALPGAVLEPPELARRLQLNAAVNPGNSGGPVVDLHGQVIGVANATVPGGYGLGFAVPAPELQALLDELSRTGRGS